MMLPIECGKLYQIKDTQHILCVTDIFNNVVIYYYVSEGDTYKYRSYATDFARETDVV